jgi:16S rRNA processing protein RimM
MSGPGRLLAGEIGKPHGLGGEVYVMRISDDPRRFEAGSELLRPDGSSLTVEAAREHGTRLLVKFAGVDDRSGAEALRGPVYIPADQARTLEKDEFWGHELAGCAVVLPGGEAVGVVRDVVPGRAQDLLAIETDRGARLVPAVKEIVVGVDIPARRVTIDPPEGLLD